MKKVLALCLLIAPAWAQNGVPPVTLNDFRQAATYGYPYVLGYAINPSNTNTGVAIAVDATGHLLVSTAPGSSVYVAPVAGAVFTYSPTGQGIGDTAANPSYITFAGNGVSVYASSGALFSIASGTTFVGASGLGVGVQQAGTWTVGLTTGTIAQVNPASATSWGIFARGTATAQTDPAMVIGGSDVANNFTKTFLGTATATTSPQTNNVGQGIFLQTYTVPNFPINGATRTGPVCATQFTGSIGGTLASPTFAPFGIFMARTQGAGSSSIYEPLTVTPTGTNGDMGLIVQDQIAPITLSSTPLAAATASPVAVAVIASGKKVTVQFAVTGSSTEFDYATVTTGTQGVETMNTAIGACAQTIGPIQVPTSGATIWVGAGPAGHSVGNRVGVTWWTQ